MDVDLPLNTNYFATHNFSGRPETVDQLKSGLSGGSFGKGATSEQGEASGLMEAIERYSGIFQGDEIRVRRRFADFAPGDAIPPNDVLLYSEAQSRGGHAPANGAEEVTPMAAPFDPSAEIEWSPVWSLRDQRFRYLPTSLLYFFYSGPGRYEVHADSNCCAMPTPSGGTTDRSGRKWTSPSSMIPTSVISKSSWPKPDGDFGYSTSPATSAFRPSSRSRTGWKMGRNLSISVPAPTSMRASPRFAP
jgi:hypothetical protein